MTTKSAQQMIASITAAWDSHEQYLATAASGLSESDADALSSLCDEHGEMYGDAESEVLEFVRNRVNAD